MGVRAVRTVVFDLFDTLVDLRWENLPMEEYRGRKLPATVRALHAEIASHADVDFDAMVTAFEDGARAFRESHLAHGREVTSEELFGDLLERLDMKIQGLPAHLARVHMSQLRAEVRVPSHHVAVLRRLRERGLRIGLCSNFSHSETALGILEESGLQSQLDAVVVSDAFGLRKPRREIFDETLARLEATPETTLHVGDSLNADIGGAAPLGIGTVWITRRIADPARRLSEHEGPQPDHSIADLAELADLLDA